MTPNFEPVKQPQSTEELEDYAIELHEWLSLVSMHSPRVICNDQIDPYLSRYRVPERDTATSSKLVTVEWSGFLPSSWIRDLFVEVVG